MTLGERIKEVRKTVGLTQVEFGEKIGIKGNTVTSYETNVRVPQEVTLKAICDKFGMNYEWLKYCEGEMISEVDDDVLTLINKILSAEDETAKQVFRAFANFDERDWQTVKKMIDNLQKK